MKGVLCLLLLPVVSGSVALLGGYKAVDRHDPLIENHLRPVLKLHGLGAVHITRVEQQTLHRMTNYKVYIESDTGAEICMKILCTFEDKCKSPVKCDGSKVPSENNSPPHHHLLGGPEPATKDEVQEAMLFAVEKINAQSNNFYRLVAEDVTNITKQIVAGVRFRFTLSLVSAGCRNSRKNKGKQLGDSGCQMTADSQRQHCHISVLKSLSAEYSLESLQCGALTKMVKRALFGGDDHDYCHVHLEAFRKFKEQYEQVYDSKDEEAKRFRVFCLNMKRIETIQKSEQGSAKYGVTKFADLSEEEFRRMYLSPKWDLTVGRSWLKKADIPDGPVPDNFDWRSHGAVTPVKNQGMCGSCWAFSTTGNIEGQWAIHSSSKELVSLSEQELVDCDKLDEGCNGGLPSNAYEAIMKLGGLESETDYSYKGRDEKCRFNRSEVAVKISGALNISSDEKDMQAWLYKNGPISIGINAFAMQFYWGGIAHPWKIFCNPSELDHGVLIVGYGVKGSEPFWIIKNSWGDDWGEKGYYLVYRGAGVCGLNTMCTSATIN